MHKFFQPLTILEHRVLRSLSSPEKIQDFLDKLKMNFNDEDPCMCPREVLRQKKAHCMEGALLAAAAFWYHGHRPLLLDLTTTEDDEDHVLALFQKKGFWGAVSKTNHAVLRYREPIYKNVRELVMSYFHEYFLYSGQKTLRTFSKPFNLTSVSKWNWFTSRERILDLIQKMADSPHSQILQPWQEKSLRKASQIEIRAGQLVEWRDKR